VTVRADLIGQLLLFLVLVAIIAAIGIAIGIVVAGRLVRAMDRRDASREVGDETNEGDDGDGPLDGTTRGAGG
jgi:hypothetical protein